MVRPFQFLSHPNFAGNFIYRSLAKKLQLPLQPLQHPLKVQALNGGPIGRGSVNHCTEPITVSVSAMHQWNICLLMNVTTMFPMVLSFPWMQIHVPQISWKEREFSTLPC